MKSYHCSKIFYQLFNYKEEGGRNAEMPCVPEAIWEKNISQWRLLEFVKLGL